MLGHGLIGTDPKFPQVVVAANGGSDLIYLPALGPKGVLNAHDKVASNEAKRIKRLGLTIARILTQRDYVSGLFADPTVLGDIPGALSFDRIGLLGDAITPRPALVVNFRSFIGGDCDEPQRLLCTHEIADTALSTGGGMHGGASRADTWNFMAARRPDFRKGFMDPLPTSNADIGMTIANLLDLHLTSRGRLTGRVLTESFAGHEADPLPDITRATRTSDVAGNGQKTILKTQSVLGHTYYDVAGFPGRSAGLE